MAKLIRCPSGHVYDTEAHASCPECARTEEVAEESGAAPNTDGDGGGSKRGIPASWLVGGGAALAVVAAGFSLLRPATPVPEQKTATVEHASPASATPPAVAAADPDFQACIKTPTNDQQPCDRAIASGKFAGGVLAKLYLKRGFQRGAQQNADAALSDFGEALKFEPNNASALAGLGTMYVKKGDCTRGVAMLDQAIRLDTNIIMAYVGRASCLSRTGNLDGARADYRKALSLNPDPATRKSVELVLDLMASAAPASAAGASGPQGAQSAAPAAARADAKPATRP